ncbi:DUF917 domain-containing protein [Ancylobacter rudongensis]|uniref:DUF917 domain-containing protein n=1 Tax=Ancylobacter rudongensis TaxID=177413 RepID=A0A1G4QN54_9HYPH|nr:DUF917 domain-containing protein [Ancylobacter rudongensis]SCW45499.1 hypothetical protein SAMN05660859_1294 [Ancylobacter rudongensis]
MRELDYDELEALAIGAGVLGTGGGNHPHLELMCAQADYRRGRRIRLVDPDELADDGRVAVVCIMGAPLVTKERLPEPQSICRAVRRMEAHTGAPFDAIMSIEIGGENAFFAMLVGMELGLPVVDADTMGRAFPEAQMASFAIRGLEVAPFAIADIRDNEVLIARAESATRVERIGRRIVVELGSIAGTCTAPRSGAEVKAHAILRSVSRAIAIGRAIQAARAAGGDPVAAIVDGAHARLGFTGKVEDVSRRTEGGFVRGTVRLAGGGSHHGTEMLIDFQNEFSVARCDGALVASVPDLITVLDEETAEAIGAEVIRYGQRVAVVVLAADPIMRSPEGLAVVGPRAFGYDFDYRPFEELAR